MRDAARVAADLRAVRDASFASFAGTDPASLAREAFSLLADPDPVLRDELAYAVLANWITDGVLAEPVVRELLARAEHALPKRLGETGSDTVFGRSFAALIVAAVLYRDNAVAFLAEDEWRSTVAALCRYCKGELDVRAEVAGKGWAHTPAHAADAVDECFRSRFATRDDCRRLFDALATLVARATSPFEASEDERIAYALTGIVDSGRASLELVRSWISERLPESPENWRRIAAQLGE